MRYVLASSAVLLLGISVGGEEKRVVRGAGAESRAEKVGRAMALGEQAATALTTAARLLEEAGHLDARKWSELAASTRDAASSAGGALSQKEAHLLNLIGELEKQRARIQIELSQDSLNKQDEPLLRATQSELVREIEGARQILRRPPEPYAPGTSSPKR